MATGYAPPMLTDYSTMTPERAKSVVDDAIAEGERLVASVVGTTEDRTYANTLAPMDTAITALNDAFGVGGYMGQVHPDDGIRQAGSEAEEAMDKWLSGLAFRDDLYEAVKA